MTQYQENDKRAVHLLMAVDEAIRKSGGRHLLTTEEYLEIINHEFRRIYGRDVRSDDDRVAATGS